MSYAVSLLGEGWLLLRSQSSLARVVVLVFTVAGFLAHTAYLLTRSQTVGLPPLLSSQQDWLLVLAWIGGLVYLVLLITDRQLSLGVFMLPPIVFLVIVAIFVSRHQPTGDVDLLPVRRLGMVHAASLVLGIAAVMGAAISGGMYLLHHQRLRSRSGWFQRLILPSLENLTAVNRGMVVFSVPCLTIGLVTGFVLIVLSRSTDSGNSIHWTDPTIITTMILWVAMIVVLIRVLSGSHQTGKAVAQLSLLSTGFLVTTFVGPMFLSSSGNLSTFHYGSPLPKTGDVDAAPVDAAPVDAAPVGAAPVGAAPGRQDVRR